MSDPLLNSAFGDYIDPAEEHATLVQFLGQTYSEISKYDSHLVSANPFLAPKKEEFQRTAEKVLSERKAELMQKQIPQHVHHVPPPQHHQHHVVDHRPYIDTGRQPSPPLSDDPNQMEFSFDNSVTAKTINEKLDELEKRIKKLDTMVSKVLSYLESHESQNTK